MEYKVRFRLVKLLVGPTYTTRDSPSGGEMEGSNNPRMITFRSEQTSINV